MKKMLPQRLLKYYRAAGATSREVLLVYWSLSESLRNNRARQWRINHDANDAMAWGPPLKGAPEQKAPLTLDFLF